MMRRYGAVDRDPVKLLDEMRVCDVSLYVVAADRHAVPLGGIFSAHAAVVNTYIHYARRRYRPQYAVKVPARSRAENDRYVPRCQVTRA